MKKQNAKWTLQLFVLFAAALSQFYVTPSLAADPVAPVMDIQSGEVCLFEDASYSHDLWRMNNWRKKQQVTYSFPQDKTPTGLPCIQIDFQSPQGGCNVISPQLKKGGDWRSSHYQNLSFWMKGKAGTRLTLVTKDASYTWTLRADAPQWTKVILPISLAFTRQGKRNDMNAMRYLMVNTHAVVSLQLGDFRLEPALQELPTTLPMCLNITQFPDNAVTIDGKMDESVWQNALPAQSLTRLNTKQLPRFPTEIRIGYDSKNLYIAADMTVENINVLKTQQKDHDAPVWQDDCLEVLIDDNLDARTYKHFIANAIGTQQDYRYQYNQVVDNIIKDSQWNPQWASVSHLQDKRWIMEIALPLEMLKINPAQPFGLQIGREYHSSKENSQLSPSERFIIPRDFAICQLGGSKQIIKQASLSMKAPGQMVLQGNIDAQGLLSTQLFLADQYGTLTKQQIQLKVDQAGQIHLPFEIKPLIEGKYRMVLSVESDKKMAIPLAVTFPLHLPSDIQFGDIFLNPRPKEIKLRQTEVFTFDKKTVILISKNATSRTRKTARWLRNELYSHTGLLLSITDRPTKGVSLALALRINATGLSQEIADRIKGLSKEGYYLDVKAGKTQIIGTDEAGLYYAAVTLLQYYRAHLVRKQTTTLGGVTIFDWPDRSMRIISLWMDAHRRLKEPSHDPKVLKHWLKTYVAGNKFNFWSPMLDYSFEFDREAGVTAANGFLSRKDYEDVARFAHEHFIEVVPAFQSGGHSSHLTRAHPEFKEPGYDKDQANVQHKDFYDVLFSCYQDILDAVPDTKYFFIWHDEWWHHPTAPKTDTFNGKARWEIFRDDLLRNHEFFSKRGITLMTWSDMLLAGHNGGPPWNISRALKELPRDILMANWSVRTDPNSTSQLHAMGFPVVQITNHFKPANVKDIPILQGSGIILYGHFQQTFWYSRDSVLPGYVHSPFRAGDYAWNMIDDSRVPMDEWRRKYLNVVNAIYNLPPRRTTAMNYRPVDLAPWANASRKAWFGQPKLAPVISEGQQELAYIPMQIAPETASDMLAPTLKVPDIRIEIPKGNTRSLFFLQGTYLPKPLRNRFKKRGKDYLDGVPLGEIQIEYTDGPTEITSLRMGMNTMEIHPGEPRARFMYGTRYTHDTQTAEGKPASLYLLEWVNPWPKRKVKSIVWKSYNTEATPVLLALTQGY